jgi:hypothetical protein
MSLVVVVLLLLLVTVGASYPLSNTDTWFHLSVGRGLLDGWSLGRPGRLSSFGDVPWVPTQWGSDLVMAQVQRWFGLAGVAWLFGLLYVVLVLTVHVTCRRFADAVPAAAATLAAVVAAQSAVSARPQVVTLVLLSVVAGAWLRAEQTGRAPYVLVPLTWLWASAHGMWSLGVVLSGVCAVGLVADLARRRALTRRTARQLVAVPVLSLVAAVMTPLGAQVLAGQVAVGQRSSSIGEWGAPTLRDPHAVVLAGMVAVTVACWATSRTRGEGVPWMRLLLLLAACGAAATATRLVACAAVLLAPVLAAALTDRLQTVRQGRAAGDHRVAPVAGRAELLVLGVASVLLLSWLAVQVPRTADRPGDVPTAFGSRLEQLPAGSPVAVDSGVGAWVEWRYPGLDPVIDGMLDAYPLGWIDRYHRFADVGPGWRSFLADSGARVAVLQRPAVIEALRTRLHWRVTAASGRWRYLVAPAAG